MTNPANHLRAPDMTTHLALAARPNSTMSSQQAIVRLRNQMDIIRASKTEDIETREYAYRMLKVISDFVNELGHDHRCRP
jgi:hypothetical protein